MLSNCNNSNTRRSMATSNVERYDEWMNHNHSILEKASNLEGNTTLHVAARSGYTSIVQEIIRRQRNLLVSKNFNGDTAMHLAAAAGHTEVIKCLIEGATMDVADSECQRRVTSIVREIIRPAEGSHLLSKNFNGDTPMHLAAAAGHKEVIKCLIEGAAMDAADSECQRRVTSIVREIIWPGEVSLLLSKNFNGDTPMHLAAAVGHTEVIMCLIEGATMDAPDSDHQRRVRLQEVLGNKGKNGNTPLLSAIRNRHLEMAEILVQEYPEAASITDDDGRSAFSLAVDFKLADLLRAIAIAMPQNNAPHAFSHAIKFMLAGLLRAIAIAIPMPQNNAPHLYMRGYAGPTLLHGTILRNDLVSMDIVLERYPQLIRKNDEERRSPLHYAAALGSVEMVDRLLARDGSVVYKKDKDGKRPIHLAAQYGHTSVLSKLVEECPATIGLTDGKGQNVVHLAAENGKVDTINYLISLPLIWDLVNQCDKSRYTPFLLAAMNLHNEVVRILSADLRLLDADYIHCQAALQVLQSVEFEAVSRYCGPNTRTTNGNGESQDINGSERGQDNGSERGQDIVDSNYDTTIEHQKHLTLKELKKVRATQAQFPEDILDVRSPKIAAKTKRSREMTRSLLVVTSLVATFTFSAVYNIPGGFKNGGHDEGTAALHNKLAFKLFVIFDAIAMASSIISTVVLFWTSWEMNDKTFMDLLAIALPLTWLSLMAMGLAFVTGLYAVLSNVKWLAILVCTIGCTFPAFITLFIPLLLATAMTFRSSYTYNANLLVNPNMPLRTRLRHIYVYGLRLLPEYVRSTSYVPFGVGGLITADIVALMMKKIIKLVLRRIERLEVKTPLR